MWRRLNGLEAMFLRMERGSCYQHTLKIAIVDPSTDPQGWSFDRYGALVEHQMRVVPLMAQRYLLTPLGLHQPVWVDDPEFDVDTHLRRVACPAPGGMVEFCRLVEQVYCHPLDHQRPLWQVWVVEGLEGGRVALLALIHHSYSDGAGFRTILEEMSSTEPCDLPVGEAPERKPAPLPSPLRRLAWAARDLPALAKETPSAVRALLERRRQERAFAAGGGADRPSAADRRKPQPFGGLLPRGRRFACDSTTLEEMSEVRKVLGGTINDVFLCCVSGSVRRYLRARDLPCRSPLVASMPFTSTPPDERPEPGGNYSSADDLWLHPEIDDPVERLAATIESATATKAHYRAVAGADPFKLVDLVPGPLVAGLMRLDEWTGGKITPVSNIVVSNVPGPKDVLYLGRWRMERWFSTGQLWHGAALNFTGWSYAGQFNLCVSAGSRQVPDAWELVTGYRAALEELLSIARARTGSEAPTASAPATATTSSVTT